MKLGKKRDFKATPPSGCVSFVFNDVGVFANGVRDALDGTILHPFFDRSAEKLSGRVAAYVGGKVGSGSVRSAGIISTVRERMVKTTAVGWHLDEQALNPLVSQVARKTNLTFWVGSLALRRGADLIASAVL